MHEMTPIDMAIVFALSMIPLVALGIVLSLWDWLKRKKPPR
jgi:hypothetical protein